MKIYTRTGDRGTTGLFGAGRVSKDHPRVDAYGTVDELNSVLGWALTSVEVKATRERLERIQHDLFSLGAALASPGAEPDARPLPTGRVEEMEGWIDEAQGSLPEIRAFILPGGTAGGAALHVARTVCRRAERAVVVLVGDEEDGEVEEAVLRYLNRLSDLLFVMARLENHEADRGDVVWEREEA